MISHLNPFLYHQRVVTKHTQMIRVLTRETTKKREVLFLKTLMALFESSLLQNLIIIGQCSLVNKLVTSQAVF